MSYTHFYKKLEQRSRALFPSLAEIASPTWDHLISPLELRLPKRVLENAQAAISALHAVSRRPTYAAALEPVPGISEHSTRHESVLMAYDFHTTEEGDCFLVEVNTNASGFLFSSLMELTHSDDEIETYVPLKLLKDAFTQEMKSWGKTTQPPNLVITDEDMAEQKMFAEFLMYRDWFRRQGWSAELCDSRELTLLEGKLSAPKLPRVDFVYNRMTDFYLASPQHHDLRQAYVEDLACVSPNPREYWLLADKQRLIELSTAGFLSRVGASAEETAAIEKVLIPTFEKDAFTSPDEIWAQRKSLFFKPKRSYGGKSVYRGESVSRKVFERLMAEEILIQQYRAAQRVPTDDPRSVLTNWKFDLRFYVYRDQIQLVIARIYQGQVTNFASPLGGYTAVRFV